MTSGHILIVEDEIKIAQLLVDYLEEAGYAATCVERGDDVIAYVKLQSITLKGTGVRRILHPLEGEDVNYHDYFISQADFCYNGYFYFFGLPAGGYELVIKAQGYKPIVEKHFVVPGKQKDFRVTELTSEKEGVLLTI